MSLSTFNSSLVQLTRSAGQAASSLQQVEDSLDKTAEAGKKAGPSMEELFKQMQQLQIFAGTMSSSFTKPLLDSFEKGEISSGEFRKQLEMLLLKLKEIRALGNVDKQGYGNLDKDKGDIEKILGEMDKNMGGRRP